jgi:hypothetical protein
MDPNGGKPCFTCVGNINERSTLSCAVSYPVSYSVSDPYDWEDFESLEAGVRLDVAISNDGRFFVNEITRWYAADFFSLSTLGPPHTQLCSSYATALHEYFS